jgi:hypothetical protein
MGSGLRLRSFKSFARPRSVSETVTSLQYNGAACIIDPPNGASMAPARTHQERLYVASTSRSPQPAVAL